MLKTLVVNKAVGPNINVLMMEASATQLSKLDCMQHLAEQLCST